MSYESVSALLGGPGKLVSEIDSMAYERTETYCWYSTEDKRIRVSFSDGRVWYWGQL